VRALEDREPISPEDLALLNGLGLLGKPGATAPAAAPAGADSIEGVPTA
jgi:hypothetical protein